MIGFLRFVGVLNAAVWLGAAVFITLGAEPAISSPDMRQLLGNNNFPYFSGAITQIVLTRYFHLNLVCGIVALLHLLAEWLYLGRPARKFSLGLLLSLVALALISGTWLLPRSQKLHATHYSTKAQPTEREAAARSFGAYHLASEFANLFMIAGLAVYAWRMANPADTLRFVSSVKFRG